MRFLILMFTFMLTGCATVNYSYKGKLCETVLDSKYEVVLKCSKQDVHILPIRDPQ